MLSRTARLSLCFAMLLMVGGFLFSAPHVFAQADAVTEVGTAAGLGSADLVSIIGRIISVFLGLLGIIFLILFIYAGFLWMTAGGDDKKVEKAKRILINGTIGLVITLGAYGITSFIINAIGGATGFGTGGSGTGGGGVSVETLSGALGSGPIRDHYPKRNQTDVPRNSKVMITFKDAIDATTITTSTVKIYPAALGSSQALTNVTINATPDAKTFVFKPGEYLGSPTEKMEYTVELTTDIKNAGGNKIFSGRFSQGYRWSFETGTVLDLTPPSLLTVTPPAAGAYARNISIQATFSEPLDPTSASGVRTATSGFDNIFVSGGAGAPVPGSYEMSNGYTSVSFSPADPCGTNSCGETIMCLPGNETLSVNMKAATTTVNLPQADDFPYNGVVDMAGNSLDGNNDGTGGDSYNWSFATTGDIALLGPKILSISPNITQEDVPLDEEVSLTFEGVLKTSSVSQDTIVMGNKELSSGEEHEMWYSTRVSYLTNGGEAVTSSSQIPAQTLVTLSHGTFLQSVDGKSYAYSVQATSGLLNEYQNCYVPAEGPDASGGACGVSPAEPFCCNGVASAASCTLF